MLFYFLFAIVAFFSLIEIGKGFSKKRAKKLFLFFCFIFYILSFLRWEFGTDWYGYTRLFEVMTWKNTEFHEVLFSAIMIFARNAFGHYTYSLFLFASILFFFQTKAISKLSAMPLTTLLVLTGTYLCNVGFVRQQVAMAIVLYSIVYIIKRDFVPFFLLVLCASGFHYSALVFIPAWWLFNVNLSRKAVLIAVVISLSLYAVVTPMFAGLGQLVGGDIGMRIGDYTEIGLAYEDTSTFSSGQLIIKAIFNRGLFFLIGFYLYDKPISKQTQFRHFFNLYCFGTILFFLTSPISIILTRMSWYYDFSQILIVPYLFMHVKDKGTNIALFLLLTAILGAKLYLTMNAYEGKMFEYKLTPLISDLL